VRDQNAITAMKAKYFFLSIALILTLSCKQQKALDKDGIKAVISTNMQEQEDNWNRANIEGFMDHYWKSDSLKFIGKRGMTMGWQATLDNYKKGYPDASAMGKLQFTNLHMEILDAQNAFVIGKWELYRSIDTLSGHYTLLWKKMNEKWVIVADHSS
jgi:Domain of unknown function (DUF4440)